MTNLLEETIETLALYHLSKEDVSFVSDGSSFCEWEDFEETAKAINYDSGYGSEVINTCLQIVGDGWWLERHEYDGSEWWEHKTIPVYPYKGKGKVLIKDHYGTGQVWSK